MASLIGKRFGRLVVVSSAKARMRANGRNRTYWRCRCVCGQTFEVESSNLKRNNTTSCGCIRKDYPAHYTHGMRHTSEYNSWAGMIQRCHSPNNAAYPNYGGRGIKVCERWRGKDGASRFMADMGRKPSPFHSLERKENDGDYCPSNCRWATRREQNLNKRNTRWFTWNGETKCLADWERHFGFWRTTIPDLLRCGRTFAEIAEFATRKTGA